MEGKVLLVGANATEVLRSCGTGLDSLLGCLPDGETGLRTVWINFLAATVDAQHPDLETVNRPHPVDPTDAEEWRQAGDDWVPRGYNDHWQFVIKPAMRALRFDKLGYADEALRSYAEFCALRAAGAVAPQVRFMVAVPLIESAIRPFLPRAGDFERMWSAYEAALVGELATIAAQIPAHDLALQLDICMEVLAVEVNDDVPALFPWTPAGTALER